MEESSIKDEESAMDTDVKEETQDEHDEEEIPKRQKSSSKRKSYREDDEEEKVPKKKKKIIKQESSEEEQEEEEDEEEEEKEEEEEEEEEEDFKPAKKKSAEKKLTRKQQQQLAKNKKKKQPEKPSPNKSGGKKTKKEEEETAVWKWWEEDADETKANSDGSKWHFLEHCGPLFAPLYEPLPDHVKFYYDKKKMRLSEECEEVATFYGKMLDHDYTTKEVFNKNFFKDWRKVMTEDEKSRIRDLSKCDFNAYNDYFKGVSEARKARSKEEKKAEKVKNEEILAHYGFCTIDGHKEKIGNFRIEPPGLFRGRGEHPKQGMHKRRVRPEDVIINCSKDSDVPQAPEGHKWKEVRHDSNVTWLASWSENIQNQIKYVMLNPSSKLKGEKDMQKYEKARELKSRIDKIRTNYVNEFKSKEMKVRQRSVALYFIDKLALRAGNEKDEEQADTVGCCSLRVEHISLHPEKDGN
jgi:DNA topoisomerase-1